MVHPWTYEYQQGTLHFHSCYQHYLYAMKNNLTVCFKRVLRYSRFCISLHSCIFWGCNSKLELAERRAMHQISFQTEKTMFHLLQTSQETVRNRGYCWGIQPASFYCTSHSCNVWSLKCLYFCSVLADLAHSVKPLATSVFRISTPSCRAESIWPKNKIRLHQVAERRNQLPK